MRAWGRTLLAIAMFRAALGAVVLVSLQLSLPHAAAVSVCAFGMAQLSDHFDGWLARRYSTPNLAGYLQDSISDKLFHVGCLLGLGVTFTWIGVLLWGVLARELLLMGLRVVAVDVEQLLTRFKFLSVAYAGLLRLGILAFLLAPFAPTASWLRFSSALGYGLVSLAVICGIANVVVVFRAQGKDEFRRR
jgi:phosphatidylglycerophosphate synthase